MEAKHIKALLPAALIVAALVIAVILIASRPDSTLRPAAPRTALIDVTEVQLQDLRIPIKAQGVVRPHRDTEVVSEVEGKIVEVSPSFHAGGYVAADEMLVRIDDRNYQAALLRARSDVAAAASNLAQEKGRAEVARREWEQLPNRNQRTPESRDLYLRLPQLEQAKARLLSAQAEQKRAEGDLERTTIRAPYAALIQEKHSDLGRFVTPGTTVARVFSVDFAEVRLALPQSKLGYLELPRMGGYRAGTPPMVDLYTNVAGNITHWLARLHRTEAALDERSRVLFAVARIDDPYALKPQQQFQLQSQRRPPLRVGTFVKANILSRLMTDIVPLPRHILRASNQVWVVDGQQRLRNRNVATLRTEGDEIYVTGGLANGELVALTNISDALPGMDVRINNRSSTRREQDALIEAAGMVLPAAKILLPGGAAPDGGSGSGSDIDTDTNTDTHTGGSDTVPDAAPNNIGGTETDPWR